MNALMMEEIKKKQLEIIKRKSLQTNNGTVRNSLNDRAWNKIEPKEDKKNSENFRDKIDIFQNKNKKILKNIENNGTIENMPNRKNDDKNNNITNDNNNNINNNNDKNNSSKKEEKKVKSNSTSKKKKKKVKK